MNTRGLAILAASAGLAIAMALTVTRDRAAQTEIVRPLLYPDLGGKVNEIARVEIASAGEQTLLARADKGWIVENRGGYPAIVDNVKRLVLGIADLRIIASKTRRPELHARLGVEDIASEGGVSRRVTLKDAGGATLVSLIVGSDRKTRSVADAARGLYVRRDGEDQALLVAGELVATSRPADWMDTMVIDIGADRLHAVTITQPDGGEVAFSRKNRAIKDYELANIPEGQTVRSIALLTSMATALSGARFDDVSAISVLTLPAQGRTVAVYQAVDGLEIEVTTAPIEGTPWSTVRARYNPQAVLPAEAAQETAPEPIPATAEIQAEADAINARTGPWLYRFPDFKVSMLTKKFAELVKPADAVTPAPKTGAAANQAAP
jgi:hypothetical protein